MYFIGILFLIIVIIVIWFRIPFSPLSSEFQEDVEACGYVGISRMSCLHMEYKDIAFKQGMNGPKLKIDYTQYNSVAQPNRLAFIDSSLFAPTMLLQDYFTFVLAELDGEYVGNASFDVDGNEPAIHMYKSFGFVEVGRIPGANKYDDGSYADNIFMIKRMRL